MQSLFTSLRSIGFLTIALTIALAANFAYGEWASPPEAPPADNVMTPVNIGKDKQEKTGDLAVWNLNAGEKVKTSTTSGQVWSPQYCDGEGENCLATSDMVGDTTSTTMAPIPPTCTGNDALQWNGSEWSCQEGPANCNTQPRFGSSPVNAKHLHIVSVTSGAGEGGTYQCDDGSWVTISEWVDKGR